MELFQTRDHYILSNSDHSLIVNRLSGSLKAVKYLDLQSFPKPICLGLVYGLIGKLRIHPDSDYKLLLVRQRTLVGQVLRHHDVYKINKIAVLSLSPSATDTQNLELDPCDKHHVNAERATSSNPLSEIQSKTLKKTWNSLKSAAETVKPKKKDIKDREKFERRILEELLKMYNDSESFYYSATYDLTNSIQRQHHKDYDPSAALWQRADSRFFWNKHMLSDLIESQDPLTSPWIVPIIHGYVASEVCLMDFMENHGQSANDGQHFSSLTAGVHTPTLGYVFSIVSRRSRYRAGTRAKRRGLDENGHCANYVETEQIIEFSPHVVSFVQVRGSAPMFWSQTGFKYRPPPRLDKGEEDTFPVFSVHMNEQLQLYKNVCIINLTELQGKEAVIGEAYLDHVLAYNHPDVTFVAFDFHDYCRGLKFENVSILTDVIRDVIKAQRYCWADDRGMICEQRGAFRINCIDCLDRTNVVQTAIARIVMETQFRKLGLLPPDETLPTTCRQIYQQLWANNGDIISRQYAGTAALKGDFTRTGERKLTGMMKDGMNSANRYYLRFNDAYRQATFDLTLGQTVTEDVLVLNASRIEAEEDEVDSVEMIEKEENVKSLIEHCKTMLIVEPEECLGGWGMVDADPISGEPERQEMDMILLLSQRSFYVVWYDDNEEQFTRYQRIYLEDIESLEIGADQPSLFKPKHMCLRLHYRHYAEEGYFHSFRAPNTRYFNNMVTTIKSPDEAKESLVAVCHAITAALEIFSLSLNVQEKTKLDKRKSPAHPEVTDIQRKIQETSLLEIQLPRNASATDLSDLQQASGSAQVQNQTNEQTSHSLLLRPSLRILQKSHQMTGQIKKRTLNLSSKTKRALVNLNRNLSDNVKAGLHMPNISIPLNKLNPVKIVKFAPAMFHADRNMNADIGDHKVHRYSKDDLSIAAELINLPNEAEIVTSVEEEVVLDSCGILATTSSHLLITSLSLDQPDDGDDDNENSSKDSLSKQVISPQEGSEVKTAQLIDTTVPCELAADANIHASDVLINDRSQNNDATCFTNAIFNLEEYDLIDSDEVNRVQKLSAMHHPNMKVSLSEGALTHQTNDTSEILITNIDAKGMGGPLAKLRLHIPNITLPNLISPTKLRTKFHRNMQAIASLESKIQSKFGAGECKSQIILI